QFGSPETPTNLNHIVFGIVGSEQGWQSRRNYIESWWRPNVTRGYVFLDQNPNPSLLPWPETSPPYRISSDLREFLNKSEVRAQRMVNGIMEVLREVEAEGGGGGFRWLVMGDDDTIFFTDNLVDMVSRFDHRKYYYLGARSEFIYSNYWFSFDQAFGGGGIMLSYPLAKAMAKDMKNCLKRYAYLNSADNTTRACVTDLGTNLLPQQGNHQLDFRGDISGLLSSHPIAPLISLHHFDFVDPIFPTMDRFESTRHLMSAASADQSRMLQQTICYHRGFRWSLSVSWGYLAQIYETILPRSHLHTPIETFQPWLETPGPPHYMFNTRLRSAESCLAPHLFYLEALKKVPGGHEIQTTYARSTARGVSPCRSEEGRPAEFVRVIQVFSPATKRYETDRCECCDIIRVGGDKVQVKIRRCLTGEVIA
ncbi:hypothetical protein M569_12664, partial [Genlisea aurea]